jgi:hypothetical protein
MPDIDVKAHLDQLRKVLPYVPPIAVEKIKALHEKGDLGGVVKLVRNTMNVNVHLTLHWTSGLHWTSENSATWKRPNAPAWIVGPEKMPYYGTDAFKEVKVDLFITKEFAGKAQYYQFAMAVAHELSHVVLDAIDHPLRQEEKAVDLTAMLLGFSYLYRKGAHTVERVGNNQFRHASLGYLSEREIDAASKILIPSRMRDHFDRLAEHAAGRVDLGDLELRAGDRVGIAPKLAGFAAAIGALVVCLIGGARQ